MATDSLELQRYSRTAIWLHWIIAALLIINLFLGFFHEDFEKPVRSVMMSVHKATGLTVLWLTLVRIAWRLRHRPPALDSALKPWEAGLARAVHALFYLALLAIPLSGWLLTSSGNRWTSYFGLFQVPPLPIPRSKDARELFEEMHQLLGYAMLLLVVLHVGGALKHHLQGHRHLIGRMAPWRRGSADAGY
jgi:cytochrome b561